MFTKEILDQSDLAAYVDREGIYRYVNKIWQEKTGISYAEAVGRKTSEIISGSSAVSAMKTERIITGIRYFAVASGRKFSASVRYRPVRGKDGAVCGCLVESVFDDFGEAVAFSGTLKNHEKKRNQLKKGKASGNTKYTIDDIIGESDAVKRLKEQIYIASETSATVLIEGETGTGKELVAHAIHNLSTRSAFPFIRVNCSAIPASLMESEFFGYEEGSFTGGAKGGREGKFQAADHGSLFLDEINAMDLTMQPKLLRALQEKEIEKIGGVQSIAIDDRIIAASNAPLEELVEKETFRQDLYYRLNIIHIVIPPLSQREEDVIILTRHFIERYNRELNRKIGGITEEVEEYLKTRTWPGNIRELQNNIERAMIGCKGEQLTIEDFTRFGRHRTDVQNVKLKKGSMEETDADRHIDPEYKEEKKEKKEKIEEREMSLSLSGRKETIEIEAIREALIQCRGNKSKTAEYLNISRTLLYRKMKKYNL